MKRRTFIKTTSLAGLASPFLLNSCKAFTDIPIIDTHQHLWNLKRFPLTWVPPLLDRDFLMSDYLEAIKGQNVVKSIYMEVDVPLEYRKLEAEWALKLCKSPDNPTVAAVIRADPSEEGFEEYMHGFDGNPYLKGIRYFFGSTEEMLHSSVMDNLRLLGKSGLSFDLLTPPEWMPESKQLLDKCPDTQFILNHCGRADPIAFFPEGKKAPRAPNHDRDQWYRDIKSLAQRPNVICKISGIISSVPDFPLSASDLAPIIHHCIEVFGTERVIFAGDWPVCLMNMPLSRWISTLKEVIKGLSLREQQNIFHDNAANFYGLGKK